MIRLLLWALIAWPLPAMIAGALGWRGIWGSGSALADYLIPLPVAGGALHVPSFVVAAVILCLLPGAGAAAAARLRALLFGGVLAGVLLLLDLQALWLAQSSGAKFSGGLWQDNPLGLFLLSDALLALIFTALAPQRPWLRADPLSLVLLLLPAALPLGMARPDPAADVSFIKQLGQRGDARGDELLMVFTRLDLRIPAFRAQAEAWAEQPVNMAHPRFHIDAEDMALLFTRNREAGQRRDHTQAEFTLCLYEDGTPLRWLQGEGDCFSGHEAFGERLDRSTGMLPSHEPAELRRYLAAQTLCAAEKIPAAPSGQGWQLTSARICEDLPRRRRDLLQKYPDEPRLKPVEAP